jgi:hypothetical protein
MLTTVNPADQYAAGRLIELFSPHPAWHRSLWSVGLVLTLVELCEASSAHRSGTLHEASVKRLISSVIRVAGKDPALTDHEQAFLREQIREVPRPEGVAWAAISQLGERINADYLLRWARVCRTGQFSPEQFARSIAGHLLDTGFSNAYLHRLTKHRLYADDVQVTLGDLCEELQEVTTANPIAEFEVLVAFGPSRIPLTNFPTDWVRPPAIADWLRRNGFSTAGIRPTIGVVLRVPARDPYGAAEAARSVIDRLSARAAIGTGRHLSPVPFMWVRGHAERFQIANSARGVRVEALSREQLVFATSANSNVDAAIELLAHLENSSPATAVAGGWGAIEGLLGEPGDRARAADNLAALVACSVPRAELTALSYTLEERSVEVKQELSACRTNRDRAELVAQWVIAQRPLDLPRVIDRAAVQRLSKILANPSRALQDIQVVVADAFHRLYRQRNLILHGGMTNSVALVASLRTVSKLAGAGIDRVAHGVYVQEVKPLELVARAKLSISMITPATAVRCVDLLGS